MILDNTLNDYRPIVQVIDNIGRNHKLGLIFEFKIGSGRILVCASNLPAITEKPEARQMFASILNYMLSDKFAPETKISQEELKELIK